MLTPMMLLTLLAVAQAAPVPVQKPADDSKPGGDTFQPDATWKALDQNLWFDARNKRVILRARICQTDATLEHLMCLKGTKEHESILTTEALPKLIHAGLLMTGANPGHPVRFEPKFEPPTGSAIAITAEWRQSGQTRKADVREWVQEEKSGKPLSQDWVFAGSELFADRRTKKMVYAAEDGDLITVANFASSILDLPYRSSASDADHSYKANPDRVPPRGTWVTLSLSPRLPAPAPPAAPPPR